MSKSNNHWSEFSGDFNKRASLALDGTRGSEAARIAEAQALAEENPNSPLAHHVLGYVRAALGDVDEALTCLRRAAEIAPNCLEIAFTLAHAYAKAKQFGPAAEECKRALDVVNPVDPRLHTVGSRRYMAFTNWPTRVAAAKERLRGLLTDALAAMARERLNGMSNEEQHSFLTVRVEDLQAHYHNQEWLIVLADATKFVTNTEAWFYFLCPECNRAFLEAEHFQSHVEEEHMRALKLLLSNVPRIVAYKQTGFLESWISPKPTDIPLESEAHQGNEIVRKIKDAVLHLKDRKALSVKLVDKLVEFTKGWLGKTAAVPKDLSCIASLDHAGLQVLGSYLERLQSSSGDWPHERACGGEHNSPDVVDVVIQIQDACVLSVDIDKIVSGRDAGSSNADVLFSWLFLREERLPSWASMRQDCIAKGTEVLEKLDKMKDLLMKQVNLKSGLNNVNEDYFPTQAAIDVEIFRIHAEVDYLKRGLVKACRFDYDALILPVMKAHLWHKLNRESPGKGFQGVDEKVDEENITNTYDLSVQNDSDVVFQGDSDAGVNNGSPGKDINGVDDTGSNVSHKRGYDSIAFQSVGGEPLPEYSTLTSAKQISDSPGKSLPTVGDNGAEGNLEKWDDSLPMLNSDLRKDLSEVDDMAGRGNLEKMSNLNAFDKVDGEVEMDAEDHKVLKSDQQSESPRTAKEQDNLGQTKQTSMTIQCASEFGSYTEDKPSIAKEAKVASSSGQSGTWENISHDIIGSVLQLLPCLADRVSLRCVCRPWRDAARIQCPPPPFPLLVLPKFRFFSFSLCQETAVFRRIPLPKAMAPDEVRCVGSFDRWLVLARRSKHRTHVDMDCFLLKAFSQYLVRLPQPCAIHFTDYFSKALPILSTLSGMKFEKVVLSAAPDSDPTFSVAASIGHKLAIWQPGMSYWCLCETMYIYTPDDVAFYKGKFYLVSNSTRSIMSFELQENDRGVFVCHAEQCVIKFPPVNDSWVRQCSLVEWREKLLLVVRYRNYDWENTLMVEVFALDFNTNPHKFNEINNLDGDCLFISSCSSKSFSSCQFDEVEADCIYFVNKDLQPTARYRSVNIYKYNLRDASISAFSIDGPEGNRHPFDCSPVWVFPSE